MAASLSMHSTSSYGAPPLSFIKALAILFAVLTMMFFDEEEQIGELMRRRFFNNESCHRTCIDLGISEDKYYRLLKIGIAYARECAIQLGLIKVFEIE